MGFISELLEKYTHLTPEGEKEILWFTNYIKNIYKIDPNKITIKFSQGTIYISGSPITHSFLVAHKEEILKEAHKQNKLIKIQDII